MKALERLFAEKLLKVKAVKIPHLLGLQVGNLLFIATTARLCLILHFVTS